MDGESRFHSWVELPEARPVMFGDLPGLIAEALHQDPFAQAAAEINLKAELRGMVTAGALMVRDPATLGRHPFPIGEALRTAVLLPAEDLRPLLESRGIGLRLVMYGSGPIYWTIEKAAAAIATQEGWHSGACETLRGQMVKAATDGVLTVRHPHTCLPYLPDRVRDYYELVTPSDVNAWLALDPTAPLVWSDKVPVGPAVPARPHESTSRPIDYVLMLEVGETEKLFPLALVASRTGRAAYASSQPDADESDPGFQFSIDMHVNMHEQRLKAAVLSGMVTPYLGMFLEPAPRYWDPEPSAGYVLPLGELRKFADLLLMEVRVKQTPPPSAVAVEPAPAQETAKDRRARLLAWLDEEEAAGEKLGALARVVARERQRKPKADYANIRKDIVKGRAERLESRRPGVFDGLLR